MLRPDSSKLYHRTVCVVGGGQVASNSDLVNNGRAICMVLARRGARVVCVDKNLDAACHTVSAVSQEGGSAVAVAADIGDPAAVRSVFARFTSEGLHGLVLNVGISDRRRLSDITPESWNAILDINLRGHMLCAQAALPLMPAGGSIVFISSVCSQLPLAHNPAYEASKAGISALARAVAQAGHEQGIRANVVQAGFVDTPMGRAASQARPERASRPMPFGRMATGWDVAEAVGFLISDQAGYVNATELVVDGGLAVGLQKTLGVSAPTNASTH